MCVLICKECGLGVFNFKYSSSKMWCELCKKITIWIPPAMFKRKVTRMGQRVKTKKRKRDKLNNDYCWDDTHFRGGSDKGIATCMDCGKLIGAFFENTTAKIHVASL